MRVVLPAPSGPTSPMILAGGSAALIPASAVAGPKVFTSPSTRAAGGAAEGGAGVAWALTAGPASAVPRHRRLRARHPHRPRPAMPAGRGGISGPNAGSVHQV